MAIEKMANGSIRTLSSCSSVDGSRWGDIAGSFDSLVDRAGLQRKAPDNLTMHSLRHDAELGIAGHLRLVVLFYATKALRPPSAIRIWAIPGCLLHIQDSPAF